MTHEPMSTRAYYLVYFALLFFTATTVVVTFVHLGRFNLIVALLIAFTKASLVVWIFMDVRDSSPLTKIFIGAGIFWFLIMIVLTFSDYMTRNWLPLPAAW